MSPKCACIAGGPALLSKSPCHTCQNTVAVHRLSAPPGALLRLARAGNSHKDTKLRFDILDHGM